MLYLEFLDGQGLGNQLWNYVTLRSISKKLGFGYEIINPEKFKGKGMAKFSFILSTVVVAAVLLLVLLIIGIFLLI